MSTVGLKLGSLVIRTISKPIANAIKAQARDHPTFRRLCIHIAQAIHRTDMRLRLGLLRDAATIEKLEAAERAAKTAAKAGTGDGAAAHGAKVGGVAASPHSGPTPMVGTSTSTSGAATSSLSHGHTHATTTFTTGGKTFHIRPLSETKAIDRGAAFISEFFLFAVAGSLILFESLRSRRKEMNRQDVVTERLELLEERTRQDEERLKALEEEVWRLKGGRDEERKVVEVVPLWEGGEKTGWWKSGIKWARGKLGAKKDVHTEEKSAPSAETVAAMATRTMA
ncbi:optic atrophy 3 protein-domain-containing protein [Kalaharituber pfeilii]|nr:optic atrophy 3 protein-domain-containing protein [Kalaharituber pfeilii]